VLNQALKRDRTSLYGVRTVQFATETPASGASGATSNVTLVYLGHSLAGARSDSLLLAARRPEGDQGGVAAVPRRRRARRRSLEDDLVLQKLGLETISASQIPDERSARAFVENKIIELRLGIAPPPCRRAWARRRRL